MKCIALVVLMALAAVNAGTVKISPAPLELNYLSYPAAFPAAYPFARSFFPYGSYLPNVRALPLNAAVEPIVHTVEVAPVPISYSAPVAVAPVAVAPAAASVAVDLSEPTYVASNPGVTHVAPLPGHKDSVISDNIQPALLI